MAIFIDRRPKLDKTIIVLFAVNVLVIILGLKGCNSDYYNNKTKETKTTVTIVNKSTANSGNTKILRYVVGNESGSISVNDSTFNTAKIGHKMSFYLSRTDYEGYGWIWLIIPGVIFGFISIFFTGYHFIKMLTDRYL